jgi:hypothetical protein
MGHNSKTKRPRIQDYIDIFRSFCAQNSSLGDAVYFRNTLCFICTIFSNDLLAVKMAVFWVVAPCSVVEVYWRFSKHLWNAGEILLDYTAQQPRRQPSSYTPPWNPKSHNLLTVFMLLFRYELLRLDMKDASCTLTKLTYCSASQH